MRNHRPQVKEALRRLYGSVPDQFQLTPLKGDASTRSYYRLSLPAEVADGLAEASRSHPGHNCPRSLVVMQLPEDALRSDEAVGGAAPEELPFLNVQHMLAARDVPVPQVYLEDLAHRVVLLEDLGDETLELRLARTDRAAWPPLYRDAVELLARLHQACGPADSACIAYRRRFDRDLVMWELDHFRQWGLEALHGPLSQDDRSELQTHFERLGQEIERIPAGFVHRDYQSRNLMWAPRESGETLVVIDFQDALLGPRPYDLVALLCDSYVDIDRELQDAMIGHYLAHSAVPAAEAGDFRRSFWSVAVQRKLKDAGRFVFMDRMRGNPAFLRWYPQSLKYVGRALDRLGGLDGLAALLKRLLPGFADQVPEPAPVARLGGCSPGTPG